MNSLILCYILVFVIFNVRSLETDFCETPLTDLKNKTIDFKSFCKSKTCLIKCCGENEVIHASRLGKVCRNIHVLKKELSKRNISDINKLLDYTDLKIYKNDIYRGEELSSKKIEEFTFLQSEVFMKNSECSVISAVEAQVLEDGSVVQSSPNHYEYWTLISTPDFCIEKMVGTKKGKLMLNYIIKLKNGDEKSSEHKNLYTAFGMLISAFFLILVLVVYIILPHLRNIQGMLLTAYVATLTCTYILKGSYILYSNAEKNRGGSSDCTVITEITYYFILASFFWLKLMCFDIWWTFRGSRKRREIHRRGINVKFMIYASYAYGTPAAITIFAVIMDKMTLPRHIMKPFFNNCFITDTTLFYLYVPLMILTGCNCLLFIMTMYNIWLIKRNLASFDKSIVKTNKNNQNTLFLYIKLCSLMGVSWILEFIQITLHDDDVPLWLYIILNSYNVLIGPIIFFMFVFKRTIFLMLCKRFDIENRWTRQLYNVNSGTTRTDSHSKGSKSYSRTRSTITTCSDAENDERMNSRYNTATTAC